MGSLAKPDQPEALKQLSALAESLVAQTKGARKEVSGQLTEALKTGGVGAQIPIIQRSVENSKLATSNALSATGGDLARAGLSRTPYGQATIASTRTAGDLATANIPTSAAANIIGTFPSLFAQLAAPGVGATSQVAGQQLNLAEFNAEQQSKFYEDLKNSIQSLFGQGGGGGGGGGIQGIFGSGNTGGGAGPSASAGNQGVADSSFSLGY